MLPLTILGALLLKKTPPPTCLCCMHANYQKKNTNIIQLLLEQSWELRGRLSGLGAPLAHASKRLQYIFSAFGIHRAGLTGWGMFSRQCFLIQSPESVKTCSGKVDTGSNGYKTGPTSGTKCQVLLHWSLKWTPILQKKQDT